MELCVQVQSKVVDSYLRISVNLQCIVESSSVQGACSFSEESTQCPCHPHRAVSSKTVVKVLSKPVSLSVADYVNTFLTSSPRRTVQVFFSVETSRCCQRTEKREENK